MTIQNLHEQAVSISKQYLRCEAQLLTVLQQLDAQRGFEALGFTSLYAYCTEALKLSDGIAYALMQVSRKSVKVPELKTAVESGQVSLSKASRIASILTPDNQETWIDKAKTLPKSKLEREIAREFPQIAPPERVKPINENQMTMTVTISAELFEQLKRIQDLESSRQKKSVSLEAAIQAAVATHLHKHDPLEKAKRSKHSTLPGQGSQGRVAIPVATKHQVALRDGSQCTAQTPHGRCTQRRWLDTHHIIEVAHGGANDLANLKTLCSAHHRMHHQKAA